MNIYKLLLLVIVSVLFILTENVDKALCQEPLFDLPVQLIGFPVIILSVRLSNFAKKLAYSLNPASYRERTKRSLDHKAAATIDVSIAEKEILKEFGQNVCVLEEPCKIHATRFGERGEQPNWNDILRKYQVQSRNMKQWYLLSVFVGDVVRDVSLCKQLSKRLPCKKKIM